MTKPLDGGERREREKTIIRAVVGRNSSLEAAEKAIGKLYEEATGDSDDLNDAAQRERLFDRIPDLVLRLSGATTFGWASRAEAKRARSLYIAAAERRERNRRKRGLRADIVQHFTEWLDGLYRKLRQRATDGGYFFLANTILTTLPGDGHKPGPDDFLLRGTAAADAFGSAPTAAPHAARIAPSSNGAMRTSTRCFSASFVSLPSMGRCACASSAPPSARTARTRSR